MKRVVTALIEPDFSGLFGWWQGWKGSMDREFLRGFYVPDEPYRVIYALNDKGDLQVRAKGGWDTPFVRNTPVCFIPRTWIGKRVNRWVVPLSAARRAK